MDRLKFSYAFKSNDVYHRICIYENSDCKLWNSTEKELITGGRQFKRLKIDDLRQRIILEDNSKVIFLDNLKIDGFQI